MFIWVHYIFDFFSVLSQSCPIAFGFGATLKIPVKMLQNLKSIRPSSFGLSGMLHLKLLTKITNQWISKPILSKRYFFTGGCALHKINYIGLQIDFQNSISFIQGIQFLRSITVCFIISTVKPNFLKRFGYTRYSVIFKTLFIVLPLHV